MITKRTAYAHRKSDVTRNTISAEDLARANGILTLVSYGDFIDMFRLYVEGALGTIYYEFGAQSKYSHTETNGQAAKRLASMGCQDGGGS